MQPSENSELATLPKELDLVEKFARTFDSETVHYVAAGHLGKQKWEKWTDVQLILERLPRDWRQQSYRQLKEKLPKGAVDWCELFVWQCILLVKGCREDRATPGKPNSCRTDAALKGGRLINRVADRLVQDPQIALAGLQIYDVAKERNFKASQPRRMGEEKLREFLELLLNGFTPSGRYPVLGLRQRLGGTSVDGALVPFPPMWLANEFPEVPYPQLLEDIGFPLLAEKVVLAAKAGERVPWLPGFEGEYQVPDEFERNWFIKTTTVSRSEAQAPHRHRLDVRDLLNH